MVPLQLARRASSFVDVCFVVCILVGVARAQQFMCVSDLTNADSCYNEREVICNNSTGSCLPGTVTRLSYGTTTHTYTVIHGSNLPYNEESFDVIALQLCHEKALKVTISDLACGEKCTSRNDKYISNSFLFSCSNLPNLISLGLTIVLFEKTENPSCSHLNTMFVVIDTRGLKTIIHYSL